MQSSFYIYLPSNDKTDINNTQSNFIVNLPIQKELSGKWECGLTEIIYPFTWPNITKKKEDLSDTQENEIGLIFEDDNNKERRFVKRIVTGHYDEIKKIIDQINLSFKPYQVYFAFSPISNRIYVVFEEGSKTKKIIMSQKIQYIFGFEKNEIIKSGAAKYPIDLRAGINSIFIYSNIVQPTIVGSSMVQLLRICPIEGSFGNIINKVFSLPHYIPLSYNTLSEIKINLKDNVGNFIPFSYGTVILKLHFRKQTPFY